jgi:OOP family OmpA-OmpF porin
VNDRVALQRAEKVKKYLISKGIAENRILGVVSKRDTEPLVPNTNEENRIINRRVEIKL